MFQLVYKFITEKQFKYKICYTNKECLNNTISDEYKFTGKNSHHNNLCLTVLQVKEARVLEIIFISSERDEDKQVIFTLNIVDL